MKLAIQPNALQRPPDETDFSDLTASRQSGPASFVDEPDGLRLVIPFTPEPTPTERARIRVRLLTRDAAEEARFVELQTALDGLKDDPSPYAVALRELLNLQLRRVA